MGWRWEEKEEKWAGGGRREGRLGGRQEEAGRQAGSHLSPSPSMNFSLSSLLSLLFSPFLPLLSPFLPSCQFSVYLVASTPCLIHALRMPLLLRAALRRAPQRPGLRLPLLCHVSVYDYFYRFPPHLVVPQLPCCTTIPTIPSTLMPLTLTPPSLLYMVFLPYLRTATGSHRWFFLFATEQFTFAMRTLAPVPPYGSVRWFFACTTTYHHDHHCQQPAARPFPILRVPRHL